MAPVVSHYNFASNGFNIVGFGVEFQGLHTLLETDVLTGRRFECKTDNEGRATNFHKLAQFRNWEPDPGGITMRKEFRYLLNHSCKKSEQDIGTSWAQTSTLQGIAADTLPGRLHAATRTLLRVQGSIQGSWGLGFRPEPERHPTIQ